jgi:ubiquinone/menaquinone biosynthesis C-methylase UbiE
MPSGSVRFDRAADYYDETRGLPPGVDEQVAALIVETAGLDRSSRVLEIGAGTGRITLPLAPWVGEMHGIDLSRPMLAKMQAKKRGRPVSIVQGDATRLPYAAASFDMALAVHVFHLIPDTGAVLAELARVLRPGGRLALGGGGPPLWSLWQQWRARISFDTDRHVGVRYEQRDSFPAESGWQPAGEPQMARYTHTILPRRLLEMIEGRRMSSMWRMTDAEIAEGAAAMRDLLLETFGDLDRPVLQEGVFRVRMWLPPARAVAV